MLMVEHDQVVAELSGLGFGIYLTEGRLGSLEIKYAVGEFVEVAPNRRRATSFLNLLSETFTCAGPQVVVV